MNLPTLESINLAASLPVLILAGWACLLTAIDLFISPERKHWTAWLAVLGLLASGVALGFEAVAYSQRGAVSAFGDMAVVDGFALFLQGVFLLSAFLGILLALNYLPRHNIERGEYYTLLLFTTSGMMLMAMAADLIVVFLALELLSLPLYVLSGFAHPRLDSEEAAMKYFLLGAFASGFLVYGIALTYGGAGTTLLSGVVEALVGGGPAPNPVLAIVGMGLILVGLGFKVAAVPFHMWTPDVYQGAPTPVTAFMSVGAKAGGFAALLRVFLIAFPATGDTWGVVIAIIAALTMILGNVVAISQSNVKRMLAYSSIAHAGYVLVAVAAARYPEVEPLAVSAAVFYLLTYAVTNLGAFAIVIALERDDGTGVEVEDFAGLAKTRPWLAIAMTLFMLSLTGIPPSAGMVGKFFVFQAAVQASVGDPLILTVTIIGVLTSVISAFYYLRIPVMMYFRDGEGQANVQPALGVALALTALATFLLGVVPAPFLQMARHALLTLAG
ncbi:MAG TPA: NADH-quinone oxidoreductase subunit N [Chloroflexi bacterium]|nr:NADH-quinone oxidoreductase subunit N [Chloroflexota bacterium]